MTATFLVADPHFGHEGVCKFTYPDGSPLRPWDSAVDMDRDMIELWNQTVAPTDKVYVLGDFCINRKALQTAKLLNGDKILIKGNHDIFKLSEYIDAGFRDIRAYHVLPAQRVILSHIPVHPNQLTRWRGNIHGHLHGNVVMRRGEQPTDDLVWMEPDERYVCVSVEQTSFKPILLDKALDRLPKPVV